MTDRLNKHRIALLEYPLKEGAPLGTVVGHQLYLHQLVVAKRDGDFVHHGIGQTVAAGPYHGLEVVAEAAQVAFLGLAELGHEGLGNVTG